MRAEVRAPAPLLVLGLGNLLLQDDGAGLALLERLRAERGHDRRAEFVDGGTQGIALSALLGGRRAALILDAVARGSAPGSVHVVRDPLAQAPASAAGLAGGAHAANAGDLLRTCALLGDLPARVTVVGLEPAELRTRIGLSPAVERGLPAALAAARAELDLLLAACAEVEPCTS
jgi:hydrogenase maturation protease